MRKEDAAKEIFFKYDGNYFQMQRENTYETYKEYRVPKRFERKWYNELLSDIFTAIKQSSDNKSVAHGMLRYCFVLCDAREYKQLTPIMEYVAECAEEFDTFSLCLVSEGIFDVVKEMQKSLFYRKKCLKTALLMLSVWKKNADKCIAVSNSYTDNGVVPDYLAIDAVFARRDANIEKWEKLCSDF